MRVSCSTYLVNMRSTWSTLSVRSTLGRHAEVPVLDVVLLRDVAGGEVTDPVHRHDADILDGAQQVLGGDTLIMEDDITVGLTP